MAGIDLVESTTYSRWMKDAHDPVGLPRLSVGEAAVGRDAGRALVAYGRLCRLVSTRCPWAWRPVVVHRIYRCCRRSWHRAQPAAVRKQDAASRLAGGFDRIRFLLEGAHHGLEVRPSRRHCSAGSRPAYFCLAWGGGVGGGRAAAIAPARRASVWPGSTPHPGHLDRRALRVVRPAGCRLMSGSEGSFNLAGTGDLAIIGASRAARRHHRGGPTLGVAVVVRVVVADAWPCSATGRSAAA